MTDPAEFAAELVEESRKYGEDFVRRRYAGITEPLHGQPLIGLLRALMWREYMLGCMCPARMIDLLPATDADLKYLLTRQITDEWRHSHIFADRVTALGGDGHVTHYEPQAEDWRLIHATYDHDHPALIATALNCCGEVLLQLQYETLSRPGNPLLEEGTARLIREQVLREDEYRSGAIVDDRLALRIAREIMPDEPFHVRLGRMIVERHATTPQLQEACRGVLRDKLAAKETAVEGTMHRIRGSA